MAFLVDVVVPRSNFLLASPRFDYNGRILKVHFDKFSQPPMMHGTSPMMYGGHAPTPPPSHQHPHQQAPLSHVHAGSSRPSSQQQFHMPMAGLGHLGNPFAPSVSDHFPSPPSMSPMGSPVHPYPPAIGPGPIQPPHQLPPQTPSSDQAPKLGSAALMSPGPTSAGIGLGFPPRYRNDYDDRDEDGVSSGGRFKDGGHQHHQSHGTPFYIHSTPIVWTRLTSTRSRAHDSLYAGLLIPSVPSNPAVDAPIPVTRFGTVFPYHHWRITWWHPTGPTLAPAVPHSRIDRLHS